MYMGHRNVFGPQPPPRDRNKKTTRLRIKYKKFQSNPLFEIILSKKKFFFIQKIAHTKPVFKLNQDLSRSPLPGFRLDDPTSTTCPGRDTDP